MDASSPKNLKIENKTCRKREPGISPAQIIFTQQISLLIFNLHNMHFCIDFNKGHQLDCAKFKKTDMTYALVEVLEKRDLVLQSFHLVFQVCSYQHLILQFGF